MFKLNAKTLKQIFPVLILCLGVFAVSCGDDDSDPPTPTIDCTNTTPSYMMDVKPIIDATCALVGCHEPNFQFGDFTEYEDLKEKATDGSLNEKVTEKEMPPAETNGPMELSDEQIKIIHCWIADGAPNN